MQAGRSTEVLASKRGMSVSASCFGLHRSLRNNMRHALCASMPYRQCVMAMESISIPHNVKTEFRRLPRHCSTRTTVHLPLLLLARTSCQPSSISILVLVTEQLHSIYLIGPVASCSEYSHLFRSSRAMLLQMQYPLASPQMGGSTYLAGYPWTSR